MSEKSSIWLSCFAGSEDLSHKLNSCLNYSISIISFSNPDQIWMIPSYWVTQSPGLRARIRHDTSDPLACCYVLFASSSETVDYVNIFSSAEKTSPHFVENVADVTIASIKEEYNITYNRLMASGQDPKNLII